MIQKLDRHTILAKTRELEQLSSIPAIAMDVVRLIRDDTPNIDKLSKVVERDPALAAKVLRIVNSSYYALGQRIHSVRHAAMMLGSERLSTIALSFSLLRRNKRGAHLDGSGIWERSLITALSAEHCGETLGMTKESGMLFTLGLMQDIGMVVMAELDPSYLDLIDQSMANNRRLAVLERNAYGVDHAHVGYALLEAWGLPGIFAGAALSSNGFARASAVADVDPAQADLLRLIELASLVADIFMTGKHGGHFAEEAVRHASEYALEHFNFEREAFGEFIDEVGAQIPAVGALFAFDVKDQSAIDTVVAEARDTLVQLHLNAINQIQSVETELSQLSRAKTELEREAQTDPLTGLRNRRQLMRDLQQTFERAGRFGANMSVLFLDIDHFKSLNDTYGHLAGDEVLKRVADLLRSQFRANDVVARYGGEEFVVLLDQVDADQARAIGERLCEGFRQMQITFEGQPLPTVTASIGVYLQPADEIRDPSVVIQFADEAMYRAKRGGRDQVIVVVPEAR